MKSATTFTQSLPIRFQVGARTLASIPRRMVRVGWSLDDVLATQPRPLPALDDADGYVITSLPVAMLATVRADGLIAHVRQRYQRHHIDLGVGHAAWMAHLSANTRSALRRKTKKLMQGGTLDVRTYRSANELHAFHALARPLSATTYQERLMDAGLPDDPLFVAMIDALEGQDAVRAWLLFHDGAPIAYLWCGADGDTLRYEYVGHDPAFAHLSPGTVLLGEALRQLFDDRFARFDFTEGEGQHKRQFATHATPCVDLLLMRPTIVNRAAIAALGVFDRTMAFAKRQAADGFAKRIGDRIRRA